MLSVIIPFYQRERGVLGRALQSVAAQRDPGDVEVIVVDDGSPVPAADEVAALGTLAMPVRVIPQPNAGPGAARNIGIGAVREGTRYVAFLDSDDSWEPGHLANARRALASGGNFYFADHFQLGQTVSAFARAKRLDLAQHPQIAGAGHLRAYCGDMLDQIIRGNVIGTSTVVYDRARFGALRFRTEYRNAGEDYLFWMEFVRAGAAFTFCTDTEVTYGRGVNIYSGTGWGTDAHLTRVHDEMRYRKATRDNFRLNDVQAAHIAEAVERLRDEFVAALMSRLRSGSLPSRRILMTHGRLDPATLLGAPWIAVRLLLSRRTPRS